MHRRHRPDRPRGPSSPAARPASASRPPARSPAPAPRSPSPSATSTRASAPPTTSSRPPATSRSASPRSTSPTGHRSPPFVAAWDGPLHILVNNAGVMASPADAHARGLGAPVRHQPPRPLRAGAPACTRPSRRPAAPGSCRSAPAAHLRSPVVFEDIHFEHRPTSRGSAYGQSKTANVLFAVEATRRWADDGITVNALMPGGDPHQPAAPRQRGGARPRCARDVGATGGTCVEDRRAGRRHVGAAGRVAAARRRRRPLLRGLQRGRCRATDAAIRPASRRTRSTRRRPRGCGSCPSKPDFSVRPAWGTPTRRPWPASVQGNGPPVGGVGRRYVRLLGRFPAAKIPIGSVDPSRR